jgi:hypothetical protein
MSCWKANVLDNNLIDHLTSSGSDNDLEKKALDLTVTENGLSVELASQNLDVRDLPAYPNLI